MHDVCPIYRRALSSHDTQTELNQVTALGAWLAETVSALMMPESSGPQVQPLVVPGQVSTKPTDDGQL